MHKQPQPLPVQGASLPPSFQGPRPYAFIFSGNCTFQICIWPAIINYRLMFEFACILRDPLFGYLYLYLQGSVPWLRTEVVNVGWHGGVSNQVGLKLRAAH